MPANMVTGIISCQGEHSISRSFQGKKRKSDETQTARTVPGLRRFNTAANSPKTRCMTILSPGTFGFSGGLVPGVDVLAYMIHPPVASTGDGPFWSVA